MRGERIAVIGAGFFGASIASHLAENGHDVVLCDESDGLLLRASLVNQARVHHGYHYPRSLRSGLSCAANFTRFVRDYREAVVDRFQKLYAIARRNSKVTAEQFATFCRRIDSPIREAPHSVRMWFDPDLIEQVFEVQEFAFDSTLLRSQLASRLGSAGVDVRLNTGATRVSGGPGGGLCVDLNRGGPVFADRVYSCLYARTNTLLRASGLPLVPMKHELTEVTLVEPPDDLHGCGITVMDGPFFSTMPFPPANLHSFTHVRYTPHHAWFDPAQPRDPYAYLESHLPPSNFPLMIRDAARYLPRFSRCRYVRSLFEVKSILIENEDNDGRPILYRRDAGLAGLTVVLGGKIDNIYDVLSLIDRDLAVASVV
ncbi:MAG: FAD-dependent oxidoreductase [Isosphaeraceae bacterium]